MMGLIGFARIEAKIRERIVSKRFIREQEHTQNFSNILSLAEGTKVEKHLQIKNAF